MKQKALTLAIALGLFCSTSYGQTAGGQTSFGLRAGINFQNLNGKDAMGEKLDNKLNTSWHAGAVAEIPIAADYFLQPGLLYSRKGAEYRANEAKTVISYVEIPVNLLYKPLLADGRLLLGFGPYGAIAVGGEYRPATDSDTDTKLEFENSATAANAFNTVRRFDAGANFLAGYELGNNISFQLNAQLGLVNINPEIEGMTNNKTAVKNTGFGISVGYKL
jgi:hypothetical protein